MKSWKLLGFFLASVSLLLFACTLAPQGRRIYTMDFGEYVHSGKHPAGIHFECNPDSVVVSPSDSIAMATVKAFADSIGVPFVVHFYDSASLSFDWSSPHQGKNGFEIKADLSSKAANISNAFDSVMKREYTAVPYQNGKQTEYRFPTWDTVRLSEAELQKCRKIIAFAADVHSRFHITSINARANVEFETPGRTYTALPRIFLNCEESRDFVRVVREWRISEFGLLRQLKQYDHVDPSPYETVESLDSTVFKYRVKSPESIAKPCNLRDAHHKLDSIFSINHIQIDSASNMVEYYAGMGAWMQHNWGLQSGKSRLLPFFKAKMIVFPADMSGYILDTYKTFKMQTQSQNASRSDSLYASWGDVSCGQ